MAYLIQCGNIYHEGLFQGNSDLRDLTHYKYAEQRILRKQILPVR